MIQHVHDTVMLNNGVAMPGFGLGVFGAGLATVIATTIAFSIGFYMLIKEKDKLEKLSLLINEVHQNYKYLFIAE